MSAKIASLVIVLLAAAMLAGCPSPDPTNSGDPNSNNGGQTDNTSGDNGSATDGGNNNGGTTDGGTSDGGSSTNDGSSSDGGSTSDGTSDNNGGSDTGDGTGGDTSGGDATGGDTSGNDVTPAFVGTFSGQVTCTKTESIGGPLGLPQTWSASRAITFDANGYPNALVIPGYGQVQGGIEWVAPVSQVGDTVTLNATGSGGYTATLTVEVALATYTDSSVHIVLNLTHHGEKGSLIEDGTGVHVVDFTPDGDLNYSTTTDYQVNLSGLVDTLWHVECTGTLTAE